MAAAWDISHTNGPATSGVGQVSVGGFTFAPKSAALPPAAWVALAVVGAVVAWRLLRG